MSPLYEQILVFGETWKVAKDKMDDLIKDIPKNDIQEDFRNISFHRITLVDGTRYRALPALESSRGNRFSKAHVDKNINQEFLDLVIKPMSINFEEDIIYF